ncbi:hypothetical protein [Pseudoxanthomonas beigongshangi]
MTTGPVYKWWHRLIVALLGLAGLVVAAIAFILAYEASRDTKILYSWHGDSAGELASNCRVNVYQTFGDTSTLCGDFNTPTEILEDLVARGAIKRENIPLPRSEINDAHTVNAVSEAQKLKYSYSHPISTSKATKAFGIAAAVVIGYLILAGLFFNLILWIAHGTTRLKSQ